MHGSARPSRVSLKGASRSVPSIYDSTKIALENTYQTEPTKVFMPSQAKQIITKVVEKWIKPDEKYDGQESGVLARIIAKDVNQLLKQLDFKRYRYVTHVTIGSKNYQGLVCASRMLSCAETDSYAEYVFSNKSMWCVVLVFGIYQE